jgi:hypothetical protein
MRIAVFGLGYGDHPKLAQRLFESWARWLDEPDITFHIGLNNTCAKTTQLAINLQHQHSSVGVYYGDEPFYKYPMMRAMFKYELTEPKPAHLFMWFDDDSLIRADAPDSFFHDVRATMQDADMIGSIWTMPQTLGQFYHLKAQPWFTGKTHPKQQARFATGGWWTIRSELIKKHDWPPAHLEHNGGDVLLGQLCYEQGYRLRDYTRGLGINCDDTLKCSSAKRRGFSQPPIGTNYVPPDSKELCEQ